MCPKASFTAAWLLYGNFSLPRTYSSTYSLLYSAPSSQATMGERNSSPERAQVDQRMASRSARLASSTV